MRVFVFAVMVALALPGVAVAQLEPVQDLVCPVLGCSVPSCGDELASCNAALAESSFFAATGQTTSYQAGDDGDLKRGATLSYTDNGDGTVTDNNTKLTWEKKIKLDGVQNLADLHDADNEYTWNAGNDIFTWVADLNAANFAGHNDWRIPNRREIESIVDLERENPWVDPAFNGASCGASCTDITSAACSCTVSSFYWSSSTLRELTDAAWGGMFGGAVIAADFKTNFNPVRAVRGGLQ